MTMTPQRIFLCLAAALVVSSAPVAAQDASPALFLRGATIIDGVSDTPRVGSLLIEGNAIRAVLPSAAAAPEGAEVVDLSGKFIVPGLVDSHSHWEDWMGELYINQGVTSVVALRNLAASFRAESQTSLGLPRLFHSGNRPPFGEDMTEAEIRQTVRDWLGNGPDMAHFPTYNESVARSYAIAADEVHKEGFLIFGHAEDAPAATRAGLDIVEHVWGFAQAAMAPGELRAFQQGEFLTWGTRMTDWNRLEDMIGEAVARGAYLNPTLLYEWGGLSARARERELEEYWLLADPGLVYFPREVAELLLARHRQIKNFSSRYENMPRLARLPAAGQAEFRQGFENVLRFTRAYAAAGGKIQAGTDVISGGTPGLSLHHEMEMLTEAGLTPMQALKSATSWSAEILAGRNGARGAAKVGSIASGMLADLVVLAADPLADISNVKRIERVMKNGRWIALGYHPDYITLTRPATPPVAATYAPVIASVTPSSVAAGSPAQRVVLEGSGFTMGSLVRVDGISVRTDFINPRRIEFDLPAAVVAEAGPDPYLAQGPAQIVGVVGYRAVEIEVFNPPPAGGVSNAVYQMVRPR